MPTRSPVPVKISDFTGVGVNIFEYKSGLIGPGPGFATKAFHSKAKLKRLNILGSYVRLSFWDSEIFKSPPAFSFHGINTNSAFEIERNLKSRDGIEADLNEVAWRALVIYERNSKEREGSTLDF